MSMVKSNAFFSFVEEREQIRLRKEADLPYPWTEDQILRDYKFTNVHRHHDRTSRVLREKFYTPNFNADPKTILMNAATYRYFGTYEFAEVIDWTQYDDMNENHWDRIKEIASDRLAHRERVFTGAYVITNGGISAPKYEVVVDHYLRPLWEAVPRLVKIAAETNSWEAVATEMRKLHGFGGSGFMTKEILLDTTYSSFWDDPYEHFDKDGMFSFPDDWWDWTPIGPGARRGAARVKGDESATPLKEDASFEVIEGLCDTQDLFLPDNFETLCPHDIQFQLCEFDKYERVRLGQGRPRSRYRPPS